MNSCGFTVFCPSWWKFKLNLCFKNTRCFGDSMFSLSVFVVRLSWPPRRYSFDMTVSCSPGRHDNVTPISDDDNMEAWEHCSILGNLWFLEPVKGSIFYRTLSLSGDAWGKPCFGDSMFSLSVFVVRLSWPLRRYSFDMTVSCSPGRHDNVTPISDDDDMEAWEHGNILGNLWFLEPVKGSIFYRTLSLSGDA